MKARTVISIGLLSALTAVAQTTPPSQKVAPDTKKPVATQTAPAKTAAQPAKTAAAATKSAMKPMPKPAKTAAEATKSAMTAKQARPAVKKPVTNAAAKASTSAQLNKRDPFVNPVREGGPAGPDCSVGKKCLAIDAILLRGIVRAPSGAIAVVESSTRKVTYFLRENDPVFNGYVMKITADTVTFRENVVDRFGKQSTRDIPKRVSAPPV